MDSNRDGRLDVLLAGITRTDGRGGLVTSALFGQTMSGFENISTTTGVSLQESTALVQYADITADGGIWIVILSYHTYPLAIYDTSGSSFNDLLGHSVFPGGILSMMPQSLISTGDLRP